jgi:ElaA protein
VPGEVVIIALLSQLLQGDPDLPETAKIVADASTEWCSFTQLPAAALYDLLRFRQAIFVVEQGCPYPDLDGLDEHASHLLLRCGGELAGCLRLVPSAAEIRIGRVAVAAPLRGHGFGRQLMIKALGFCRERHPTLPIVLTAQHYLLRFYESFGFAAVSEPFDDFGLTHIVMRNDRRHASSAGKPLEPPTA